MFALARAGYLPAYFAKVHPRFKTPVRALVGGGVVGVVAVFSDQWVTFGGAGRDARRGGLNTGKDARP